MDPTGQPIDGPRDLPDLKRIRALGLPFWLAGSYATPERLRTIARFSDGAGASYSAADVVARLLGELGA